MSRLRNTGCGPDNLVVAMVLIVEQHGDRVAVLERVLEVGEQLLLLLTRHQVRLTLYSSSSSIININNNNNNTFNEISMITSSVTDPNSKSRNFFRAKLM